MWKQFWNWIMGGSQGSFEVYARKKWIKVNGPTKAVFKRVQKENMRAVEKASILLKNT